MTGTATGLVVWIDGALADPRTASVHWSDHGLTVGDGVFETVKLAGGVPFALTRHLVRLDRSATALGLVPPDAAVLRAAVGEVADAWGDRPGRLRITLTGGPGPLGSSRGDHGPTLIVAAAPLTVQRDPTDVAVVPWTRNEHGALAGLKTTSYAENVVALARAEAVGASEALMANTAGNLCEGTGSNVFVGFGERLITPPLGSGCLAGVSRALLLEALADAGHPTAEEDVPLGELAAADEVFLMSTTREVQPVRRVDGREVPACPGPLTRRAAEVWDAAYRDRTDP